MTVIEVVDRLLINKGSTEIEAIVERLPRDNQGACEQFCKEFDYLSNNPAWLTDSLLKSRQSLADILDDIVFERRVEEQNVLSSLELTKA